MDLAIRVWGSGSKILPVCWTSELLLSGASTRFARKQVAASASGFAEPLTMFGFRAPFTPSRDSMLALR